MGSGLMASARWSWLVRWRAGGGWYAGALVVAGTLARWWWLVRWCLASGALVVIAWQGHDEQEKRPAVVAGLVVRGGGGWLPGDPVAN
jgi:hypothetical protein